MKTALPGGLIEVCVTLLLSIFITTATTEMQAKSLRVAICGGGVSACAAANRLASRGVDVSLFEVGRGVGGRAATRRASPDIQFNHGAQDIKSLRTKTFSQEILRWESKGWVKPWSGQHTIRSAEGSVYRADTTTTRYVGVPHMNSICKNLVEDRPISTHFSSKVSPAVSTETLTHHRGYHWRLQGPTPESTTNWGDFDWIIGADRSCSNDLLRLPSDNNDALRAVQDEFARVIKDHFVSVPNVVLMLALKEPIPCSLFPFDSVQCENLEGTVHRICKDSSKPGDASNVQKWIVQSTAAFAKNLLREVDDELRGQEVTFEERKQRVNAVSKPKLLEAFRQLVLENGHSGDMARYLSDENVLCAISHRWSVAFPSWKGGASVGDLFATSPGYTLYGQGRSFVHPLSRFAACGDYLVPANEADGIEAAVISGIAAADGILKAEHL